MDNKLKIAYVLVGIALIGHSFFSPTYVHKFVVPISIVLLLFSIIGSLRARLALIGFFLFFSFNSFILLSYDFSGIFKDISAIAFFVNFLVTVVAIILLFSSISIKETASRFSEQTPIKLTAALFLIIIVWNFIYFFPIGSVLIIVLSAFIAFSLFKKKAIGFILAPLVLIVITTYRINSLSEIIGKLYYSSSISDILLYYAFPLLVPVLIVSFIFCLKEDNLGIVNVITKKKSIKWILFITASALSCIVLIFFVRDLNNPVSLKWRYDTGYYKGHSFVMVDDVIYAPYPNGYLYAIDKSTGDVKWEYYDSDGGFTACSLVDGVVYIGRWSYNSEERDYLYAFDANDGELNWRSDLEGYRSYRYVGAPTVVDGVVYVRGSTENLYAVDADGGVIKWRFSTETVVLSTPSVTDGVVYIITDEYLYAIDAKGGELKWRYSVEDTKRQKIRCSITSLTVANGVAYIGIYGNITKKSSLHAVDVNSGELKWQYSKTGRVAFPPTVVNGEIYFGGWFLFESRKRYIYALDTNSGELIWKYKMKDRTSSSPTVADGVVYVGSIDNKLYAVDANSGKLMWKYKTGGIVYSTIIVDDGVIYFGSTDGYLYALEIMRNNQ